MDIQHVVAESQLADHVSLFQFHFQAGQDEFKRTLHDSFCSRRSLLESRANQVQQLRAVLDKAPAFHTPAAKEAEAVLRAYVKTEETTTSEQQVFFTGDHTKVLNTIPFLLTLLVALKLYVAPVMGLLTPVILFVMPYFVLRYTMNMPVPWSQYVPMMKTMIFGSASADWGFKQWAQAAWSMASFGQTMIQPCITAYHTWKIDTLIVRRGKALIDLVKHTEETLRWLQTEKILPGHLCVPEVPSDPRQAAAWMTAEPLGLKLLYQRLGQLDILYTFAKDAQWIPVRWTNNRRIQIQTLSDLAIPADRAKRSDLDLRGHALLTGPNRGGKSSSLRALIQQILLGQTFGLTYQSQGSWRPFQYLFTRLKSTDHAGRESLFEYEVRMASTILKTIQKGGTSLVCIDELFHSTNPPDAETSATLFLRKLWAKHGAMSIISTHIFSLCEQATDHGIQTLCCAVEPTEEGAITYSYTLTQGICRVSSVREVLAENGLL